MKLRGERGLRARKLGEPPDPVVPAHVSRPPWDRRQRARQSTDLLAQPANAVYPAPACELARIIQRPGGSGAPPTREPIAVRPIAVAHQVKMQDLF